MRIKGRLLVLVSVVVLVGLYMTHHAMSKVADAKAFHGTLLSSPHAIGRFNLVGIDDQPFNNQRLLGQWTFVFFGFTSCNNICPTTLATLANMVRILEEKTVTPLPQVVMVSIDPERDQLDKLGSYVKAFHPDFYGATGTKASIKKITRDMGVAYAKTLSSKDNYDIQHGGTVMLINPQGQLNAIFTTGSQKARWLVADYLLLAAK